VADPFPAHTVVAHLNTVRMYHDQFRIRYPGKALPGARNSACHVALKKAGERHPSL